MNTDITRVMFSDRARWGKEDKFKVFEEELLEQFLKYSFDWEKITTTPRFKDLLRERGVNWKGNLQFIKDDKTIFIKSTSVDDDSSNPIQQITKPHNENAQISICWFSDLTDQTFLSTIWYPTNQSSKMKMVIREFFNMSRFWMILYYMAKRSNFQWTSDLLH